MGVELPVHPFSLVIYVFVKAIFCFAFLTVIFFSKPIRRKEFVNVVHLRSQTYPLIQADPDSLYCSIYKAGTINFTLFESVKNYSILLRLSLFFPPRKTFSQP